jgi:hypothetical protein
MIPKWGIALVIVAIVGIAGISVFALLQGNSPSCTPTWSCAAGYPVQVAGTSGVGGTQCLSDGTSLYCIGGVDTDGLPHSDVYSSSVSAGGNITAWTQGANSYPQEVSGESCVLSSGYVYCTGGFHDASADDTSSSYYAQIEGGQVGAWYYTTQYPVPVDSMSCVTSSSFIYCIGGNNETDGTNGTVQPSDSAWFAALSPEGIGPWNLTTSYPAGTFLPSCAAALGKVYCVGGVDANSNPLDNTFYASLTPSGIGQWIPTTNYPLPSTGEACAIAAGYVYCLGGATTGGQTISYTDADYFAPISSSGVGQWSEGPSYPEPIQTSCAILSGRIYCVGGFDESAAGVTVSVKFASLASFGS